MFAVHPVMQSAGAIDQRGYCFTGIRGMPNRTAERTENFQTRSAMIPVGEELSGGITLCISQWVI